jgi:hypothetical protein
MLVVVPPQDQQVTIGQVAQNREKTVVACAACGGKQRWRCCWDNAGGGVYVDVCRSVGKVDQGHVWDQAGGGGACNHRG